MVELRVAGELEHLLVVAPPVLGRTAPEVLLVAEALLVLAEVQELRPALQVGGVPLKDIGVKGRVKQMVRSLSLFLELDLVAPDLLDVVINLRR